MNSEVLHSIFPITDESSSDENAHDVDDEKTTCQESSSNKDISHDVNNHQPQNRSPFYSTGERNLIAFLALFLMIVCKQKNEMITILYFIYQINI